MSRGYRVYRRRSFAALASAAVAAVLCPVRGAFAQTDNWIGGSSNWSNPANWDSDQVPAAWDTVNVTASNGLSFAVNYDYAGPAVELEQLTLDLTGGGTAAAVMNMAGNTLSFSNEIIGSVGNAVVNQSGGVAGVYGGDLTIGNNLGSTGSYVLSGSGTLGGVFDEIIGNNGVGNFNQSGGINIAGQNDSLGFEGVFYLGRNAGSVGNYTLSAGTLMNAGAYIGYSGNGNFVQTGGLNTGGQMDLGSNAGSTGTYTLSGNGTLSGGVDAGAFEPGGVGVGIFVQNGGMELGIVDVGPLPQDSYTLNAGTVSASNEDVKSQFYQYGGSNSTQFLSVESKAVYTLEPGTALMSGAESISGLFNQSGGTNTGELELSGTYLLSAGTLTGWPQEINGTLTQTGGTNTITSTDPAPGVVGSGVYNLGGTGILNSPYESINAFNQSGGVNNVLKALIVEGSYILSGGSVKVTGAVVVGGDVTDTQNDVAPGTTGILTVSGTGVLGVTGALTIFNTPGSYASIVGGSVYATTLSMIGSYSQSGGSATFQQITGSGEISLSGGRTTLALGGAASQIGTLNVGGTATLVMQLGGYTQGVNYDLLNITAAGMLGGTLEVDLVNGFVPKVGDEFTVITSVNPMAGEFAAVTAGDAGMVYSVNYGPEDEVVEVTVAALPEPGVSVLMAGGLLLAIGRRRRRRARP